MRATRMVLAAWLGLGLGACDVRIDVGDAGPWPTHDAGALGGGDATGGGHAAGGGDAAGGGGGGGPTVRPGCTASTPCPDTQTCINGMCAPACTSIADCGAGEWCERPGDGLCHPDIVQTCGTPGCVASQTCFSGFCSTPPPDAGCEAGRLDGDGCDARSLCLDTWDEEEPRCHSMPSCAADGGCPTGLLGAVCNDGLALSKARICMVGLCRTPADCPGDWLCLKVGAADPLGLCSNRATGAPCLSAGDCLSGRCTLAWPGTPGVCL